MRTTSRVAENSERRFCGEWKNGQPDESQYLMNRRQTIPAQNHTSKLERDNVPSVHRLPKPQVRNLGSGAIYKEKAD
jgi:hypothetical protein